VSGTQTIYGMHAVRVMLERHPARVLTVRLDERREDARVRAIEALAREHQRQVLRVDMHSLRQRLGNVAHQGVAADIVPLPPWREEELLGALAHAK
jgi:23S rRNA (guanosine2251-2'-O)-methyltransferase